VNATWPRPVCSYTRSAWARRTSPTSPRWRSSAAWSSKSLWYAAITKKMPYGTAMVIALAHAATAVLGEVRDPTGVDDVAKDWTPAERYAFSATFAIAAKRGQEALKLAADGEHHGAIEIWFALFGEPFPHRPQGRRPGAVRAQCRQHHFPSSTCPPSCRSAASTWS
jgi:hypothetical protein